MGETLIDKLAVSCPICRSAEAECYGQWPIFSVLQCLQCGFRFIDTEAPDYPRDAQYHYDEPVIGEIIPDQPHIRRRVQHIMEYANPPALALDIGCGKGEVPMLLARQGFRAKGIDMKPRLVQHLQSHAPEVAWECAMVSDLAEAGERFDVITLYHVLEHIPQPVEALEKIKGLARPGALIVIEVPNVAGLEARLRGQGWHYYKVDHVNYFRPQDLLSLARQLGLEPLTLRGFQHFSHPQDVWWKDRIKAGMASVGFKDVMSIFLRVPGESGAPVAHRPAARP